MTCKMGMMTLPTPTGLLQGSSEVVNRKHRVITQELGLWLLSRRTAFRTLTCHSPHFCCPTAPATSVMPETQVEESPQGLEVNP